VGQVPQYDSIPEFEALLIQVIETHDWDKMQSLMGDSFALAFWQSEGLTVSPAEAIEQLQVNYLLAGNTIRFQDGPDVSPQLGGRDILSIWDPAVNPVRAVYSLGWGMDGTGEAFLVIAQRPDGTVYWYATLMTPPGFADRAVQHPATVIPTPVPVVTPTPTPYLDMWTTFSSVTYAISLEYPADWQPVPGYGDPETDGARYGGINGFFQITAMDSDSIDAAAAAEAEHKLQPYGSQPKIEALQVQGQEARLILPSDDQPTGMQHQAALIVRYPEPVNITGTPCRYLLLWADWPHIRTVAQTLRFTR